jgi:hypothetical protein
MFAMALAFDRGAGHCRNRNCELCRQWRIERDKRKAVTP